MQAIDELFQANQVGLRCHVRGLLWLASDNVGCAYVAWVEGSRAGRSTGPELMLPPCLVSEKSTYSTFLVLVKAGIYFDCPRVFSVMRHLCAFAGFHCCSSPDYILVLFDTL